MRTSKHPLRQKGTEKEKERERKREGEIEGEGERKAPTDTLSQIYKQNKSESRRIANICSDRQAQKETHGV